MARLNAQRARLIKELKRAVEHLTLGSAAPFAGLDVGTRLGAGRAKGPRRKRQVSADARARLSRLAKARWAAAKKAGKTRLG